MPPTILSTSIRRQMDHFILAIARDPGADRPTAVLSLYWIGYTSELGAPMAGHVAYLWHDGGEGGRPAARVLTDSPALADGLGDRLRPGRWDLGDAWPAPETATFERRTAVPYGLGWRVTAADGAIVVGDWEDLGDPVYTSGQTRDGASTIATMLVSAGRAMLSIDGRALPGAPYADPIWTPWFGAPQGSCVIGVGETLYAEAQ